MASGRFLRRSPLQWAGGVVLLVLLLPSFHSLGVTANNPQLAVTTSTFGTSFTWETRTFGVSLDPHAAFCPSFTMDCYVLQNVYETLLWYNGTASDRVIPWLAKDYTISPDGSSIQFTLRDGIRFADGNPLNSTAVYFSLNRLVLEGVDGGFLCCDFQLNYTESGVERLLAQNLVKVTGPLTFQLNVLHPGGAFIYQLPIPFAAVIDPQFVMSRDLALWTGPNSTTLLPYPTLSGSLTERITEYFKDEAIACSKTDTTSGCQISYFSGSSNGSLAGTGPYVMSSVSADLTHVVLFARSDYWGGPNQFSGGEKIVPHFSTVYVNEVPLESDRLQDLRNAATKGAAMSVDVDNDQLYTLANRTAWLTGPRPKLLSIIQNVSLYGPFPLPSAQADSITFVMNVTDASTGRFYQFQPFADLRLRLAFADAVDIGLINRDYNDNMGQVAPNYFFPGSAPPGAYNSSNLPSYSFSPKKVQTFLLDAMVNPLTSFRFFNGTAAPPGVFNNTFGCRALNGQNRCDNPVSQTISLAYRANDTRGGRPTINGEVIRRMAIAINNVSDTFHMGLHVAVEAVSLEQLFHRGFGGNLYMFEYHSGGSTPWVGDEIIQFAPTQGLCNIDLPSCNPSDDGWNSTRKNQLYEKFLNASSENNVSAVVSLSNQVMELYNRAVTHVWTIYPSFLAAVTSNVQGYYYNPSIFGMYFAAFAPANTSATVPQAGGLLTNTPLLISILVVAALIASMGVFVVRGRRGDQEMLVGAWQAVPIMFTEMVGYQDALRQDEALAKHLLDKQKSIIRRNSSTHGGRDVGGSLAADKGVGLQGWLTGGGAKARETKLRSQNSLVLFENAVDAVRCAVEIQRSLVEYNRNAPSNKDIYVKIGIHVGDVASTEGEVTGEALAVASRLAPLAEPGSVCITQQVVDQLRDKIDVHLVSLGVRELKNIYLPMEVYTAELPPEKGGREK